MNFSRFEMLVSRPSRGFLTAKLKTSGARTPVIVYATGTGGSESAQFQFNKESRQAQSGAGRPANDADLAARMMFLLNTVIVSELRKKKPDAGVLRWGRLSAQAGHDGANLLIAATLLAHGLTVVTRNVGHFEPAGVAVLNPFKV